VFTLKWTEVDLTAIVRFGLKELTWDFKWVVKFFIDPDSF